MCSLSKPMQHVLVSRCRSLSSLSASVTRLDETIRFGSVLIVSVMHEKKESELSGLDKKGRALLD